jgi:hypothetical protein
MRSRCTREWGHALAFRFRLMVVRVLVRLQPPCVVVHLPARAWRRQGRRHPGAGLQLQLTGWSAHQPYDQTAHRGHWATRRQPKQPNHRRPRHSKPRRDRRLRQSLDMVQPMHLSPVMHGIHPLSSRRDRRHAEHRPKHAHLRGGVQISTGDRCPVFNRRRQPGLRGIDPLGTAAPGSRCFPIVADPACCVWSLLLGVRSRRPAHMPQLILVMS